MVLCQITYDASIAEQIAEIALGQDQIEVIDAVRRRGRS
jgi:hypothetical protein